MVIAGHEVIYGTRLEPTVIQYIHHEVIRFTETLQLILGARYDVTIKVSNTSESSYVTIADKLRKTEHKVSFRNHGCARSMGTFDEPIYISRFETMDECFWYFLRERLPKIKQLLDYDYVIRRDVAQEVNRRLDSLITT